MFLTVCVAVALLAASGAQADCSLRDLKLDSLLDTDGPAKQLLEQGKRSCSTEIGLNRVAEGQICNFTASCQRPGGFIVPYFLCSNGKLVWDTRRGPDSFCPSWRHCQWNGVDTVICDGNQRATPLSLAAVETPIVWDLRTAKIAIINTWLSTVNVRSFANVEKLQQLNMTGNQITFLDQATFALVPTLQSLDLSFNNLTSIDANVLPQYGALRYLNLRNNSVSRLQIAFGTIEAAMSYCAAEGYPNVLLDDNPCSVTNVTSLEGKDCFRVRCQAPTAETSVHCAFNSSERIISRLDLCDGVDDCGTGWDEEQCGWRLQQHEFYSPSNNSVEQAGCAVLAECLGVHVRLFAVNGALVTEEQRTDEAARCIFRVELHRIQFIFNSSGQEFRAALGVSESLLDITVGSPFSHTNGSLRRVLSLPKSAAQSLPSDLLCYQDLEIVGPLTPATTTSSAEATTTDAVVISTSSNSGVSTSGVAVGASIAGTFLLIGIAALIIVRRRRRLRMVNISMVGFKPRDKAH